ncbi:hypothetical protein CLRAG_08840 [Clostridium ragsdalei P11]|uniref:Uncharacterized protein n=1 Tax=Clostridium ragsdalei P11 TaxID=1353534 RepID=A0A1A6AZL2_9CLOT|nr:hypothetical protein [Clostridium ragsdalei]OBR95492.1 hypothetical protein CLRAG_08840 [Clostridium ragsdalei P11]
MSKKRIETKKIQLESRHAYDGRSYFFRKNTEKISKNYLTNNPIIRHKLID